MSIFSNLKKNFLASIGYRIILFLQPILLTPLIINNYGEDIFSKWIVINSLSIILFSNDFGLEMANLMSWSNWINDKKNLFLRFAKLLFTKAIFYIFCIIFAYFYIDHNYLDFKLICFIIITYQFLAHISLTISRPLWTLGYNWLIHLVNLLILLIQLLIFCFLVLYINNDIKFFLAFPIIESIKIFIFYILIKNFFNITVRNFSINNISETFKLKKAMFGFFLENISASIKVHLFRVISELVFSVIFFINIVTSLTLININKSIINLLAHVFLPELNRNKKNKEIFKNIMKFYLKVTILINIFLMILIYMLGEFIYTLWLQESVNFNKDIFELLVLLVFFQNINEIFIYVQISENKHNKFFLKYTPSLLINILILLFHKNLYIYVITQIFIELFFMYLNLVFINKNYNINKTKLIKETFNLLNLKKDFRLFKTY